MFPDTYSQYDEQQAILGYIDGELLKRSISPNTAKPGRFLDIGAWDPKTFSNTRALFERGWGGVMVEPSPRAMLCLLAEYGNEPRIILVEAAIGLTDSIVQFSMTDDCVSTSNSAHLAKFSAEDNPNRANYVGKCMVRTVTWEQINTWWGGFDFVSIDAEGYSVDLFHAMLATGVRPSCVCVEIEQGRMLELSAAATAPGVGYKLIYSNGTNAVFAR